MARRTLLVAAAAAALVTTSLWPAFAVAVAVVAATVLVGRRNAAGGFLLAVFAFAFEGTLKAYLAAETNPLGIAPERLGAAALDLAFVLALGRLVLERRAALVALWHAIGTFGRAAAALLGAWLCLSLVQLPFAPDLGDAAAGFRLTQLYAFAALGGALAAGYPRLRLTRALLWGCTIVGGYAALRFAFGPSQAERDYALSRPTGVPEYGDVFRTVGSFSAAIGLNSFLVVAATFALLVAVLRPQDRRLAAAAFACSSLGILGTYGRAALVALALGAVAALCVALARDGLAGRARLVAVGVVAVVLAADAAGAWAVGRVSPETERRAQALRDPFADPSAELRATTWHEALREARRDPLGGGLGTVGHASSETRPRTTDSSYLKVLVEQGFPGGLLFAAALVSACAATAVGLARLPLRERATGVAALGGVLAFLALAATGEYVEQPGKVLAWTMLGVAAAEAARAPAVPRGRAPARTHVGRAALLAGLVLVVVPPLVALGREREFVAGRAIGAADPADTGLVASYVHGLVRDRTVVQHAASTAGAALDDLSLRDRISVAAGGTGGASVAVRERTPRRAALLADHVAEAVVEASRRDARPHPALVLGPPAATPSLSGLGRALDRLPGGYPPAPEPGWAAVAGALVAAGVLGGLAAGRRLST
jgi:hypothetical protein